MRPTRFRAATKVSAVLAAFTLALIGFADAPAAFAAGTPSIAVNLSETDGTPTFDASDGPGLDSSASNGIVRVNDTVSYNVELSVNDADATNTTFTMQLPKGEQVDSLPPYCTGAGSSLSPSPTVPAVPLTSTSYQSLVTQTLVCNVGDKTAGTSLSFPVVARVRSEVPNGTTLGPVTAAGTSTEVTTPVVSDPVSVTASSALKWDLSKNGTSVQPDSGSVWGPSTGACPGNPSVACFRAQYPITLSAPIQGKGAEPSTGPITFTDDLSPAAFYRLTGANLATANGDLASYGASVICATGPAPYQVPGSKIFSTSPATNSVRDSGTISCSQAGPGQPVQITISNPDTSLYTYPTDVQTANGGNGAAIPGDKAYAISLNINVYVPVAAVQNLGVSANGVQTIATKNTFTNLSITGLDGSTETTDPDPTDDYRSLNFTTRLPGGFQKAFVGVPGAAGNMSPRAFNTGYGAFDGPPGGNTYLNGNILVAPNQTVVSMLTMRGSEKSNPSDDSMIGCDAWDPTTLQLTAGNYPASTDNALAQLVPSGPNTAAWMSGYNNVFTSASGNAASATSASQLPDHKIQYSTGTGGVGAASTCNSGTWYDSPADVPGNDPTLAAQGIYTAVSRVRVWSDIPAPTSGNTSDLGTVAVFVSIALRATPNLTAGQILPNYAGSLFSVPSASQGAMLANSALNWGASNFNPSAYTGGPGDRLIAAPAFARVTKLVKGPTDSDFNTGVPAVTGGQDVQYQLTPTLTSGAPSPGLTQDVTLDDCLPAGQKFDSASTDPQTVQLVDASTALPTGFVCAVGSTYIHWDLGQKQINQSIDPIVVKVTMATIAPSGTFTNTVLVTTPNDPSTIKQRSSAAQVQLVQPSGILLDKTALTPQVQVNRPGSPNREPLKWLVSLTNNNGPQSITNPNIIDVLPKNGDSAGTSFNGSLAFTAATVTSGGSGVAVWYTKAASVKQDPSDASNGSTGSTVWCDGTSTSATVVSGSGTAADCPASAADVTGLRIVRPGAFLSGDLISVEVDMTPIGDRGGDVFVNTAYARVGGLTLPVGPATAPEKVVESSVGDYVWHDSNKNGVQDSGEAPYANEAVTLTGTDDLGNPVTATSATDNAGKYGFDDLRAGSYTVTFAAPGASSQFTVQGAGTDPSVDSNPDPATGVAPVSLPINTADDTIDAGIVTTPVIQTTISETTADAGATLADSVSVSGTDGATIDGTWTLLGPVATGPDGTCATASWGGAPTVSTGGFTVNGDQTVSTISLAKATVAGCYTFVDALDQTATTAAAATAPGIASETAQVVPTIATTISKTEATVGDTLVDSVTVTGLGDGGAFAGTIDWQLVGPVAPVDGECATVDWSGAPVFDSGTLTVTADGTYATDPSTALDAAGCYTFVDALSADGTVPALTTAAGLRSETAIVHEKPVPPTTSTSTPTPVAHAPQGNGLADTGSNVTVALWAAFALLVVGLAAAVASALARRRGVRR